ncbi:MAG: hypothetical protein WKF40_09615, partial [Thermoleophilaceae bacterium]
MAVTAACSSVAYGGRTYIMYRRGVSCRYARYWVRRLHYTKRGPRGVALRVGQWLPHRWRLRPRRTLVRLAPGRLSLDPPHPT